MEKRLIKMIEDKYFPEDIKGERFYHPFFEYGTIVECKRYTVVKLLRHTKLEIQIMFKTKKVSNKFQNWFPILRTRMHSNGYSWTNKMIYETKSGYFSIKLEKVKIWL